MNRGADCDAIIVGAGIQGATVALEMARRGLRAIVLDPDEPGSANTAASFGLLHGGLRYLQRLDVARWLRSRREQSWFLRALPELTQPLPCVLPLYRGSRRSPALFRSAFLADRLAAACLGRASDPLPAGTVLAADEVLPGYPLVRDGLVGAAQWHEAVLSDGRAAARKLLGEVARVARASRLTAEAVQLVTRGGAVAGLLARSPSGSIELQTSTVVVCAGAATRALLRRFDADYPKLSSATLAFNLLLALPAPSGVALGASPVPGRGRSLFLRAEADHLLAGTWYAPWPAANAAGAIGRMPTVPPALIADALTELSACLPGLAVNSRRVLEVRVGLLPDVDGSGRQLRERDVVIDHGGHRGARGLWTVLGTKLTTARALSAQVVGRIWPHSRVAAQTTGDTNALRAAAGPQADR